MKVVILAGGYGSRLGSLTDIVPKPMVEIGGRPILWHIMKYYSNFGYKDFVICLGYKGNVIKDYFLHYQARNNDFSIDLGSNDITFHNGHDETDWNVTLVDTGVDTLKGGRIKQVEPYLDDMNLLTYGDGVADVDINSLIDFHLGHGKTVTITGVHPPARFGELLEEENQVISFEEKPQTSSGLINGGFMVFNKELLSYLSADKDCDFEIGPLDELSKNGEVMVYKHKGNWECMDHQRDVDHLNKLWDQGNAFWNLWDKDGEKMKEKISLYQKT